MAGTSQTIKPIISAGGDCLRTYDISLWMESERINYFSNNSAPRSSKTSLSYEFFDRKEFARNKLSKYSPIPILEERRLLFRSHRMCTQSRTMALSSQHSQTYDLVSSNYGKTL
jgi:hypothetical protein